MNIYLAIILALFLLTGCSSPEPPINNVHFSNNSNTPNPAYPPASQYPTLNGPNHLYDNGFRLIEKTVTHISDSESVVKEYKYNYDYEKNIVDIDVLVISNGNLKDARTGYKFDHYGRMKSIFLKSGISLARRDLYTASYDSSGRIVQFFQNKDFSNTFIYEEEQLRQVFSRIWGFVHPYEISYDAQGLRISVTDVGRRPVSYFEHNSRDEIISIQTRNEWGEVLDSHELTYDIHGNHIATTSKADGVVTYTEEFTYELSAEPIFNIGLIQLDLEPLRLRGHGDILP